MIAFLKGRILGLNLETAILDVGGVGYEVHCPLNVISELQNAKERAEIQSLFVYTNVREDAIQLFGFLTALEKDFFLTLLKVNGIGPKMALGILSGGSVQQLRNLIESEDVRGLIKLPKVGKKIAEQMILSLKGKLPNLEQSPTPAQQKENEILSALMNLGFSEDLAQQISDEIPSTYNFEEGMRWALQKLSVHRQKLNQRGV